MRQRAVAAVMQVPDHERRRRDRTLRRRDCAARRARTWSSPPPARRRSSTTSPGASVAASCAPGAFGLLGSGGELSRVQRRSGRAARGPCRAAAHRRGRAARHRRPCTAATAGRAARLRLCWGGSTAAVAVAAAWAGAGVAVAAGALRRRRGRGLLGLVPKGSEYWSSPAPWANAVAGARASHGGGGCERVPERHRRASVDRTAIGYGHPRDGPHPRAHRPRLDASAGRRDRREPLRAGRVLALLGASRDRRLGRLRRRRAGAAARGGARVAPPGLARSPSSRGRRGRSCAGSGATPTSCSRWSTGSRF